MEDIGKKAHDDEFNKGKEDIGKAPRLTTFNQLKHPLTRLCK